MEFVDGTEHGDVGAYAGVHIVVVLAHAAADVVENLSAVGNRSRETGLTVSGCVVAVYIYIPFGSGEDHSDVVPVGIGGSLGLQLGSSGGCSAAEGDVAGAVVKEQTDMVGLVGTEVEEILAGSACGARAHPCGHREVAAGGNGTHREHYCLRGAGRQAGVTFP